MENEVEAIEPSKVRAFSATPAAIFGQHIDTGQLLAFDYEKREWIDFGTFEDLQKGRQQMQALKRFT